MLFGGRHEQTTERVQARALWGPLWQWGRWKITLISGRALTVYTHTHKHQYTFTPDTQKSLCSPWTQSRQSMYLKEGNPRVRAVVLCTRSCPPFRLNLSVPPQFRAALQGDYGETHLSSWQRTSVGRAINFRISRTVYIWECFLL